MSGLISLLPAVETTVTEICNKVQLTTMHLHFLSTKQDDLIQNGNAAWPVLLSKLSPESQKSYYLAGPKIKLEKELTVLDFSWICALDLNSFVSSESTNSRRR